MRLDSESRKTIRREQLPDAREDWFQIVDVNKNIGGKNELIAIAGRDLLGDAIGDIGGNETIVDSLRFRLRDHRRRQVDTHHPVAQGTKSGAAEPGAAAEIEYG